MDVETPGPSGVPESLQTAAAWTWRVILLGVGAWLLLRVVERLSLVVLPIIAAVLLTALAMPAVRLLRRIGVGAAGAAGIVLVVGLGTIGLVVWWIANRAIAESGEIADELGKALDRLPVRSETLAGWRNDAVDALRRSSGGVGGVLNGLEVASHVLAGTVLTLFITFYLLYDGARVWSWVVAMLPRGRRATAHEAGAQAWQRLAGWVRGTVIIGVIHGVVVAVSLVVLDVPLVAPLSVLVFLGSFIPIVGAFIFGGAAVLVTFAAHGWVSAAVLVGILTLDNQLEAHVLQPFLVGRYVRLHPLAVVIAVTVGEVLEGLVGAVLAVPLTAAAYAAFSYARGTAPAVVLLPSEAGPPGELPGRPTGGGVPLL
ncbi:putative PurR-regulated permease PerM [Motilibacter peucedani]|uniref:Putative PurR-regulated permease PerM n=1 Tax=Motilibacter peucedani TaxID=598650 RepID=A0A420XKN1_9ACTN|nr:AI-2E family transporter [Motilibacter peucedani]RKS67997.1 putative PurR-regulated permease PerM [Motilibacter peucedani]